jgi:plasmid stabilization system protein ParE
VQLEISKHAKLEIDESYEYYNLQQDKLGNSFKSDIKSAIDRIIKLPTLYPIVVDNIRKSILHRFPFSIFYLIDHETIIILSIAHHSRKPFYKI